MGAEVLEILGEVKDHITSEFTTMGHRIEHLENTVDKRVKILESRMTNLEREIHDRGEASGESVTLDVQAKVSSLTEQFPSHQR